MLEASVPATSPFQCARCSATFARQDHLHRHETSHEPLKSCVCEFCSSRFHRRDILTRHYKNCRERGDHPIPAKGTTGRRRQACDRCSSHKLACDPGKPCRSCASKGLTCSRGHSKAGPPPVVADTVNSFSPGVQSNSVTLGEQIVDGTGPALQPSVSASERSISPLPEPASTSSTVSRPPIANNAPIGSTLDRMPVPFLSALVSSDSVGFVDVFSYSTIPPDPLIEPQAPPSSLGTRSGSPNQDISQILEPALTNSPLSGQNVSFYPEISPALGFFGQETVSANNIFPERNQRSTEINKQSPISRKIYELVMQLTNTFIALPKGHHAKAASAHIDQVDKFLTSSNVLLFIQTYFHHFHPHFSVIHRPSFDMKIASPRLLLAVCLAGSLYTSFSHDVGRGKSLLDLAEEFIFHDPTLKRVANGDLISEANDVANDFAACESNLEILQAAFLIVVLQNWEGNRAAQRRARLYRLQHLISLARALRLTAFTPTWFEAADSLQGFDWASFGRQQSCSRIMYHLFIIDSTLCTFYDYPPKLALAEMTAHLPCTEELFAARTSAECQQLSHAEGQPQQVHSLKETFALMTADDVPPDAKASLVKLIPLHLFILIHAIHYVLWHSQNTSTFNPTHFSSPLDRALSRWKVLWQFSKRRTPTRLWRRSGFMQHADEYWWLAQLKMQEASGERVFEDDHMRCIRELLDRFSTAPAEEDVEFEL